MKNIRYLTVLTLFIVQSSWLFAGEIIGRGDVFSVVEISFHGPMQDSMKTPSRDIEFWARFQHESGSTAYRIHGFWDGDGCGGMKGNVFKIRFCPTKPGRWFLSEVHSNAIELAKQNQGGIILADPSDRPGFWIVDPDSPGRRWYMRSNGSHPFIFGNTHYSFLSGYQKGNIPTGNDIAADISGNARYFKKIRFGLSGDHYPHPTEKPFLNDGGDPTDWGDFSHRPNPKWFHERVDLAVGTACACDLIADLILAGPDREESRSTLRARRNGGDPAPFLKYIAARYGSYPNVWICLCNEFEIKNPTYTEKEIAGFGTILKEFLPYQTPLSVHATPHTLWSQKFDELPSWNDHQIVQKKIRTLAPAADVLQLTWENPNGKGPRNKPTINDELSYQGTGDKHSQEDTIESHLGIFLGGGYGTTGEKPGRKTGQYFKGKFDPNEHSAAGYLKWLRERIDADITFWKMTPDLGIFSNLDPDFRGMAWTNREYVLGTNKFHKGIMATLPTGTWMVTRYDVIEKKEIVLSRKARGDYTFDSPKSRAVLFHFKKNE